MAGGVTAVSLDGGEGGQARAPGGGPEPHPQGSTSGGGEARSSDTLIREIHRYLFYLQALRRGGREHERRGP
jgi:hypothetical protein